MNRTYRSISILVMCFVLAAPAAIAQSGNYTDELKGFMFVPATGFLVGIGNEYAYSLQVDSGLRDALSYSTEIPIILRFNSARLNNQNIVHGNLSAQVVSTTLTDSQRQILMLSGFAELAENDFWKSSVYSGERVMVSGEVPYHPVTQAYKLRVFYHAEEFRELRKLTADAGSIVLGDNPIFPIAFIEAFEPKSAGLGPSYSTPEQRN